MGKREYTDEFQFTPAIRQRLEEEAKMDVDVSEYVIGADGRQAVMGFNPGSYWAAIQRTNGDVRRFACDLKETPPDEKQVWLMQILRGLNKELGHDGRWVVGWTHGNTRFIIMWLDEDGDIQFTVENDEAWAIMVTQEWNHWMSQAEEAWRYWHKMMREVLDPGPDALHKRAQGQRAPSTIH